VGMLMMELLAMMWKQLTNNTALAFIAVVLISGSNSYVALESSRTNNNLETTNKTMVAISKRSESNSQILAKTQRDMLNLQEKLFNRDYEQDKVIAQIYRDTLDTDSRVKVLESQRLKSKLK
jgi:GTPase Era involved in 16S rRNA processing